MIENSQIACPVCASLNVVSQDGANSGRICQSCNSPLFNQQPVTLTSANFQQHARMSDLPLFIDFWSSDFESMSHLAAGFVAAAGQLEPGWRLGRLDIETEPELAERFEIHSIPTYLIIHHGQVLSRRSGAMLTRDLVEWPLAVISG